MKRHLLLLAGCLLAAFTVSAAETNSLWLENLPNALTKAKAENKLVLADFSGSDWCPPCIKLKKDVLSSPAFEAYAKTNLVLLEVDFPRKKTQPEDVKKANKELAKAQKIEGYPTLILFDAAGKEINRQVGYGGESTEELIKKIESWKKK